MNAKLHHIIRVLVLYSMLLTLIIGLALTTSLSAFGASAVLYAAPEAQGSGNCSSWANACTLQTALAIAKSDDAIWVKKGVHYPDTTGLSDPRTAHFTLKNGVAVYGGFAGNETQRNQRNWLSNVTILSGDIDGNDTTDPNGVVTTTVNINGNNAYNVVLSPIGTDGTAVLDGFVITAGQANSSNYPYYNGGGMYNSGGNPTLTNVTFSGNTANYKGGGMYNSGGNPTLTNVTFSDNTTNYDGGGMFNAGSATLTNVTFHENTADYGGGIFNSEGSSSTLINVTFYGNKANYGGGLVNYRGSLTLTNATFHGNTATYRGGGVYNSGTTILTNATLHSNIANYGGGMYNVVSSPTLNNIIMWGNSASNGLQIYNVSSIPVISYSDIQGCGGSGSWNTACGSDGGGNIDADPRFVDASNDDLRLQLTSPAIDAGDNSAVPFDVITDLDGNERFEDIPTVPDIGIGTPPIVDMGAYEAQDTIAPTVTVNQAGSQADPTNSAPISFIAVFSESISTTTFTAGDVSLGGSTAPGATVTGMTQIAPNDGTTFQITVAGMTGSGTVIASIPAGGVKDPAGNVNLASTSTDNSVTYDITAPAVLSIMRFDPNPTNAVSVNFTVTFTEAVTGVDVNDFGLTTTGSIAGASVTGVSGTGSVYTVTVSTGTGSGTLRLDVPGTATITDLAGNGLSGLPYTGGEVYNKLTSLFLPLVHK